MNKEFTLPLLTKAKATEIEKVLQDNLVYPTRGRVIIAVSSGEYKRTSGLIIPGVIDPETLKKGVVVQLPYHSERSEEDCKVVVGEVITFGEYSGKKVEFELPVPYSEECDFYVISYHEIVMSEYWTKHDRSLQEKTQIID